MDSFFENVGYNTNDVTIRPELLSIIPFETIWKRDTSKDKTIARKELCWIWCMCCRDTANIYNEFIDKKERMTIVTNDLFGANTLWKPDKVIEEAIKVYMERNPKNPYELEVEFIQKQRERLEVFLSEFDLSATTNTGALMLDPDKLQKIYLNKIELTKKLMDMKLLANEERNRGKIRGGGTYNPLEDPKYMNNEDTGTVKRSKSKTSKT